ncbi:MULTISPECIES: DUF896 domain-containing protein [unclassified Paenibacillus]|uniref:DUF896 domain-containing protein n=1 Tax=unclassified Paenibacillus TaxID=185978 RepID=UPI001C10B31F|nr:MULTISPECIES: DUF896 domain-containing protein [unclassified Paenibacillus]MBU5443140.1 DUF896 domain-containing protein [Paenibacillus sp. MSJ-34]CAH0121152.1 hypothetical protein PAE9249_03678 [Paenibacillus sp. CECT 9249]
MEIDALVARINELARKHKSVGLTEEETLEREKLRKQYIEGFKRSLRQQLDSIEFVDENSNTIKH